MTSPPPTPGIRIYRRDTDSRTLAVPRVFSRTFCSLPALPSTVRFYEQLTKTRLDQDIDLTPMGTRVVAVGPFLLLALDPAKIDGVRYEQAMQTHTTVLVRDIEQAKNDLVARGAEVVQQRFTAPHATGYRLRDPEGLIVEYLQHRASPYDVGQPGADLH